MIRPFCTKALNFPGLRSLWYLVVVVIIVQSSYNSEQLSYKELKLNMKILHLEFSKVARYWQHHCFFHDLGSTALVFLFFGKDGKASLLPTLMIKSCASKLCDQPLHPVWALFLEDTRWWWTVKKNLTDSIKEHDKCHLCAERETLTHVFVTCSEAQPFWSVVNNWWNSKLKHRYDHSR